MTRYATYPELSDKLTAAAAEMAAAKAEARDVGIHFAPVKDDAEDNRSIATYQRERYEKEILYYKEKLANEKSKKKKHKHKGKSKKNHHRHEGGQDEVHEASDISFPQPMEFPINETTETVTPLAEQDRGVQIENTETQTANINIKNSKEVAVDERQEVVETKRRASTVNGLTPLERRCNAYDEDDADDAKSVFSTISAHSSTVAAAVADATSSALTAAVDALSMANIIKVSSSADKKIEETKSQPQNDKQEENSVISTKSAATSKNSVKPNSLVESTSMSKYVRAESKTVENE